ncbi:MAG: hypothetical protein ABFC96_05480, partial [Thermoguttaceae bacterium]
IMMMLGGVAPEALLVLFIVTVSSVLCVCSLAMAVSVWSMRAREAVTRAYLVLFVLLGLPLLIASFQYGLGQTTLYQLVTPVNEQIMLANPFVTIWYVIAMTSGSARGAGFQVLWELVRNQGVVTIVCAVWATLAVRRVHLRQRTKAARRRWRLSQWLRPPVGQNAMLWKEIFAEPAAARLGWIGRITLTLIVLGVLAPTVYMFYWSQTGYSPYRPAASEYLMFATVMSTILACGAILLIASRAAGSIVSERERDCWVSLLSTPLQAGEIIWAKIAGSVWSMRGAVVLLLVIWGLGVLLDPGFLVAVPFMLGTFLVLAFYAAAVGVRFSLGAKSSLKAMGATLAVLLFFGGLYYLCACVPVFIATDPRNDEVPILSAAPCIPFLLFAPGGLYCEPPTRDHGVIVAAYVFGVFGYLFAAGMLTASSIGRFDAATGRTRPRDGFPQSGWDGRPLAEAPATPTTSGRDNSGGMEPGGTP